MDHRRSFVEAIIRNDIGEADEEKGNEGWPAEGTERGKGFIETILIAFFVRTGNFSCSEED
jgi:hypothetical protein